MGGSFRIRPVDGSIGELMSTRSRTVDPARANWSIVKKSRPIACANTEGRLKIADTPEAGEVFSRRETVAGRDASARAGPRGPGRGPPRVLGVPRVLGGRDRGSLGGPCRDRSGLRRGGVEAPGVAGGPSAGGPRPTPRGPRVPRAAPPWGAGRPPSAIPVRAGGDRAPRR